MSHFSLRLKSETKVSVKLHLTRSLKNMASDQWRIQKLGIGGGRVGARSGKEAVPPPQKFYKNFMPK